MTDYRLRNTELLYAHRRPAMGPGMIALFVAIGFVAVFAALSGLTERFNPTSGFSQASAQAASTTARGRPHP